MPRRRGLSRKWSGGRRPPLQRSARRRRELAPGLVRDDLLLLRAQPVDSELDDVAKIVRLSGEEGASVYETLRARGKSLRVELLNKEHTRAKEASERMTLPMTSLAIVFVGIILTPLLLNLMAS